MKSVTPLNDEVNRVLIVVEAGELWFTLTKLEIGYEMPGVSQFVHFKVVDLSLWDENI